jgi:sugar phosphate isomerase/epimerase
MHERLCLHPVCFPNTTRQQLAGIWRELDARRVGLISPWLDGGGFAEIQQALQAGGQRVETINHLFPSPGQQLSAGERTWQEPRERLNRVIAMARQIGSNSIYIMTGGHGSQTWEQAAGIFVKAIAPCVVEARAAGVQLLIECAPPLYADIHLTHTLRDTVTLAEMADIGVCCDFFACWTEAGLHDTIRRAAPRLHLVQVGDYVYGDRAFPCRAVPGDGVIPVRQLSEVVLETGYQGAFDLELPGPRIDKEGHVAALRRAGEYVGNLLNALVPAHV